MTIPRFNTKKFPSSLSSSEQLVFQSHIVLWLKTNAGTENVGHSGTLLGESVDDRSAGRSKRCLKIVSYRLVKFFNMSIDLQADLQHVRQNTEDTVEALVLHRHAISRYSPPGDTGHHLCNDGQVQDERAGKEGIFTNVGHTKKN